MFQQIWNAPNLVRSSHSRFLLEHSRFSPKTYERKKEGEREVEDQETKENGREREREKKKEKERKCVGQVTFNWVGEEKNREKSNKN